MFPNDWPRADAHGIKRGGQRDVGLERELVFVPLQVSSDRG